ncbi:MAG: hypothetical protein MI810_21385, partial [Flavobacteriales bacterium]|nr:hypothetical protein [Flavobacteriales bacterium]
QNVRITDYTMNIGEEVIDSVIRQNNSLPCAAYESCIIGGLDQSNNGICQDAREKYGMLEEVRYYTPVWTPQNVIGRLLNDTSPDIPVEWSRYSSNVFLWQSPGVDCPLNQTLFANAFTEVGECSWYNVTSGDFEWSNETGILAFYVIDFLPKNQPKATFPTCEEDPDINCNRLPAEFTDDTVCAAGADFADCGASNRYADVDPGLGCPTDSFSADIVNRRDFVTEEGFTVSQFLERGATAKFTIGLDYPLYMLGRAGINDCSGLTQCDDGTCAEAECPETYYNCPGDGCTLSNPNLRKYQCACAKGFGGIGCDVRESTEGQPITYFNIDSRDPALWPFAGRPPPLRIKPPGGFRKDKFTTADVNLLMFAAEDRETQLDPLILPEAAPFGNVFVRYVPTGEVTGFYTTCGYYRATPWGTPVSRDECVQEYNADGTVKTWRSFLALNGSMIEYSWDNYTSYDEFPFRCAKTGHCVLEEADCYQLETREPNCNGNGIPLADGTCQCNRGWRTF